MIEILRIGLKYKKPLSRLSVEDKAYILDGLFFLSNDEEFNIRDDGIGDLLILIQKENENMCKRANNKQKVSDNLRSIPKAEPMVEPKVDTKEKDKEKDKDKEKVKVKVKDNIINNSLQELEQSSLVKVDKRDLEIDIIIETMKSFNLGIVDDTIQKQRRYGKLIKDKMLKIKGFDGRYQDFITMLYNNSDEYRKNHFRSLEKFYREMANIITGIKIQAEKPIIRRGC